MLTDMDRTALSAVSRPALCSLLTQIDSHLHAKSHVPDNSIMDH